MAAIQLKIILKGTKPPVWRRFVIDDSVSFRVLHETIQRVMGWDNYHLYQFSSPLAPFLDLPEDCEDASAHYRKIMVKDVIKTERQKIEYMYDFGDGWEHVIIVEKITDGVPDKLPSCIGGEMACPPEDCGGAGGYEELLKVRKNKKHHEYNDLIVEWLGEDFDPGKFDLKEVNKTLTPLAKRGMK